MKNNGKILKNNDKIMKNDKILKNNDKIVKYFKMMSLFSTIEEEKKRLN